MKSSTLSYNLQGLASREARDKARILVRGFTPKIDILCVQENKIREANATLLKAQVWNTVHLLIAPAKDGADAMRNENVLVGKRTVFCGHRPSPTRLHCGYGDHI